MVGLLPLPRLSELYCSQRAQGFKTSSTSSASLLSFLILSFKPHQLLHIIFQNSQGKGHHQSASKNIPRIFQILISWYFSQPPEFTLPCLINLHLQLHLQLYPILQLLNPLYRFLRSVYCDCNHPNSLTSYCQKILKSFSFYFQPLNHVKGGKVSPVSTHTS